MTEPSGSAVNGKVLLMIGTRKGLFLMESDGAREEWSLEGPHFAGTDIFHMAQDPRNPKVLMAIVNSPFWGPKVHTSRDRGQTWELCETQPAFPEGGEETVKKYWHIEPGNAGEPETWYVGAEPAALFVTRDGGESWEEIDLLRLHPTRDRWQPGFGGLCLHSIVVHPTDPKRIWVGISAAGVFGTDDGGRSWQPMNQNVRADFMPETFPEVGQCTHKLLAHPETPERLYQQNHCGVFRSDTAGETWEDISEGLPSRFGFVLGIHATDPDTIYVLPEDQAQDDRVGGGKRFVTEAKFRVYRSRDRGAHWEALTDGLPQEHAYLHALREGMATDRLDPCGIYIGTTTGQLFSSRDDGNHWEVLIDYLPPILSVECGQET